MGGSAFSQYGGTYSNDITGFGDYAGGLHGGAVRAPMGREQSEAFVDAVEMQGDEGAGDVDADAEAQLMAEMEEV